MADISKILPEAEKIVQHIKKGKCKRNVVNILLIGVEGVGKSSLINSLAMAINNAGHKEIAQYGKRSNRGKGNITQFMKKYTLQDYLETFEEESNPSATKINFFDMPGLPDEETKHLESVLDCFLSVQSRMKVRHHITGMELQREWEEVLFHGSRLRNMFSKPNPEAKINIVCFVHAAPDPVHENLVNTVGNVTLNNKREIPVFLVLTKMDRLKEENKSIFNGNKEEMMMTLSMGGVDERVFELSLYCEETSPGKKRKQDIDKKLCELWTTLIDPVYCNREIDLPALKLKESRRDNEHDQHSSDEKQKGREGRCSII